MRMIEMTVMQNVQETEVPGVQQPGGICREAAEQINRQREVFIAKVLHLCYS